VVVDVVAVGTALESIVFSGSNSVTVQMELDELEAAEAVLGEGIAASDTSTGTSRLDLTGASGSVDISNMNIDEIELSVDAATDTITTGDGQTIVISVDQAGITTFDATTDGSSVTLVIDDNDDANDNDITLTTDALTDYATVNISTASGDNLVTATSFGAETAAVVLSGGGDVTFAGSTTAGSVNAAALGGILTIELDDNVYDVVGSAQDDVVTITTAAGAGEAYDINTGAGNDQITVDGGGDAAIDGGAGNADKIIMAASADTSADTITIENVEAIDVSNDAIVMAAAQVSGQTLTILGDAGAADTLEVAAAATGSTINAAGFTFVEADVVLTLTGGAEVDTITGSDQADTINADGEADVVNAGAGDDTIVLDDSDFAAGEVLNGGTGSDTLDLTAVGTDTVLDLTTGTVTGFEVIDLGDSTGTQSTLTTMTVNQAIQGDADGLEVIVDVNAADSPVLTALNIIKEGTAFEASAEATAAAVDIAGEWHVDTGTETLTYYNEVLAEVAVLTIDGGDLTGSVTAGNLELAIA
jgi:hypothetical protein